MAPTFAELRSNRLVVASVVAAAIAVAAGALIAIAVQLGWIPRPSGGPAARPASMSPDVALAPGETLVVPADPATARTGPLMPTYSEPTPPKPAPPPSAETAPAPAPPPVRKPATPPQPPARSAAPLDLQSPHYSPADTPRPAQPYRPPSREDARGSFGPRPPEYARARPGGEPRERRRDSVLCENCGSVAAITTYSDAWEVRVRFEDGSTRTFRYRSRPPLRLGDPVRLEDGRLFRD